MAQKPTPIQVIRQSARKYGLDPKAVLAYALTQGGTSWGAVGDNNSSFGPFQLHRGGALGSHDSAWANSPQGLDAAMGMMSRAGARGKTGPDAAAFIVGPAFGRGANPSRDQANARAQYGRASSLMGETPAAAVVAPQQFGGAGAPAPGQPDASRQLALALLIRSRSEQGKPISPVLAQLLTQQAGQPTAASPPPLSAAPAASTGANLAPGTPVGKGMDPYGLAAKFGSPLGIAYNPLGTPGQGTHGKAFNRKGGSDNWQSENAFDLGTPVGTPVFAPADGTIDAKRYGSLGSGGRFAGKRVTLVGSGNSFYLAHLSKISVKPGARVKKGQLIGYSGEANGVPHVHYAIENLRG